jgi:cardiolipin synthase
MVYGAVPLWFGIATIVREVLVSVMVVLLASLGAARIDVLWVGKAGTFGLMFAYPTFLLAYGDAAWQEPFKVIAWVTGIVGLTLAWIAAGSYIGPARKALRAGRAARRSPKAGPGTKEPGVKRSPA